MHDALASSKRTVHAPRSVQYSLKFSIGKQLRQEKEMKARVNSDRTCIHFSCTAAQCGLRHTQAFVAIAVGLCYNKLTLL